MSWSGPRVGKEPEMENLKHSLWGRYQKKIGKMWEFFPSRGPPSRDPPPPSPQFGNPMFEREKIMVYFAF